MLLALGDLMNRFDMLSIIDLVQYALYLNTIKDPNFNLLAHIRCWLSAHRLGGMAPFNVVIYRKHGIK